jgi:hypothetical protein
LCAFEQNECQTYLFKINFLDFIAIFVSPAKGRLLVSAVWFDVKLIELRAPPLLSREQTM